MPETPMSSKKSCFSAEIVKAEKLQRVLANMGVDLQAHRATDVREAIKDVERNKDLIADSANVDDDFAGHFLRRVPLICAITICTTTSAVRFSILI